MTTTKQLHSLAVKTAHAVVDVRSWSENLVKIANKRKDQKISDLLDEAHKIHDYSLQLINQLEVHLETVDQD